MMVAVSCAKSQNCCRLQLAAEASNKPALALFESIWFVSQEALLDAAEIDDVRVMSFRWDLCWVDLARLSLPHIIHPKLAFRRSRDGAARNSQN